MRLVTKFKTANGNPRHTASLVSWRSFACRTREGRHHTTHCAVAASARHQHAEQGRVVTIPHTVQWQRAPATTEFHEVILRHMSACDAPDSLMRFAWRLTEEDGLFESYDDYFLCMAAITTQFPSEMTKRTGKNSKTLLNVLTAVCAFSQWRSCMNNSQMHKHVSKGASVLHLVGTTPNEALHAELRAAFPHPPVMRLKLNCLVLSKQVVFEGALRAPGLRQRRLDLFTRVLSRPLLEEDARERWMQKHVLFRSFHFYVFPVCQ